MPAPLTPLDDPNPLGGDRVDAAARMAWLLRMARLAGPARLSQSAIGTALRDQGIRTHARQMSEVENGKVRHGRVVDGYERALGLCLGHLRAPIDIMARSTLGAPTDRGDAVRRPDGGPLSVEDLSALGERLRSPSRRGSDWLAWSRAISAEDTRGFPAWLMTQWLTELVDELGRSVGTAYVTRYEAVAQLRNGPYARVALDAARDAVTAPHAQIVLDVAAAVSDFTDVGVLEWAADLLGDARPMALRAACILLRTGPSTSEATTEAWDLVVGPIARSVDRAAGAGDDVRLALLSGLLHDLPAPVRDRAQALLRTAAPHAPPRALDLGTRTRSNPRWRVATHLADRVAESMDVPDRAILARLVFELLWDPRTVRYYPAAQMLRASPLVDSLRTTLYQWVVQRAGPVEGIDACWRLAQLGPALPDHDLPDHDHDLAGLARFGPEGAACRAVMLAHAGRRVESEVLDELMRHPQLRRHALYAAGLAEDPWLDKIASDQSRSESIRGAARWWQERRGVIDDTH